MTHPQESKVELPNTDYSHKWLILVSVGMGVFLATIDGSIVNIGINTLVKELNQPLAVVEWVVLAYMLTISTLMLSIGRLGDMIGKKSLYIAGLITFTIGSTLCGLSNSIYWLIAFRVLQALGAAMIMALGTALVTETFPASERGKALGIMGTLVSIGIIAGPTIGGLILESLSWHWLFFVNIPIGIIGVIMVKRYVPANRPGQKQLFDFPGATALFLALASFLFALSLGQHSAFQNPLSFVLFGLFVIMVALFIRIELRSAQPMINLTLFKNRLFSVNLVTGLLTFIASAGTMFIIPLYLQNILHYSPRLTGLMMAITPVTVALVAPLAGALSDRIGTRLITSIGLGMILIGNIAVSTLGAQTTILGYLLRFIPLGIGIGMFQSPNNSAVMGSVARQNLGIASGLLNLTRTIGQTTGIALLGAFWESRVAALLGGAPLADVTSAPVAAQVTGLQQTILLAVSLVSVALILSLWALREYRKINGGFTTHPASS